MDGLGSAVNYNTITTIVSSIICCVGLVGLFYHGWLVGQIKHNGISKSFRPYYVRMIVDFALWVLIAAFGIAAVFGQNWDTIIYPIWLIVISSKIYTARNLFKFIFGRQKEIAAVTLKMQRALEESNRDN